MVYDKSEPIENLITWVYEEGSFVPSAKLINGEKFSIINDYIGRPIQSYDDKGNLVWETDYDIYGGLRNLKGDKSFIPFRQLGQYEDVETGLYYNRFRYYNSETGLYLSQDPIGLMGRNPNFYAFVHDSNNWVDIFGLDPYGPNQDVYALFNKSDVVNGVPIEGAKPYYVGISENSDVRLAQHTGDGRFNPATDTKVDLYKDIDYAKARGLEQRHIETSGSRTGVRGEAISKTNRGNKNFSFDKNRTNKIGLAFLAEYNKIKCN